MKVYNIELRSVEQIVCLLPLQKRQVVRYDEENIEKELPKKKPKIVFTHEQEEKLKESFNDDKKISLKQAREFLMEHSEMFEGRTEKMIQDKWIKMQKKFNTL